MQGFLKNLLNFFPFLSFPNQEAAGFKPVSVSRAGTISLWLDT